MRVQTGKSLWLLVPLLCLAGCHQGDAKAPANSSAAHAQTSAAPETSAAPARAFVGFDRNLYPGDDRLTELHRSFAFAGFWLNNPPGEKSNTWAGKRDALRNAGFGFLVLANGRLDARIKRAHMEPKALGEHDAQAAIAAAKSEGFPDHTLIFLDQEEGGRLLPEQAEYLLAWTEMVARSPYRPGAYISGQASPDGTRPDGKPQTITTAEDVRQQIRKRHLHPVVFWVQQDACPPAPGCTLSAPPLADSGTSDAPVWQYAQSPRRTVLTHACAATYAPDGMCYAGASKDIYLDLDVANSADPSSAR